MAEDIQKTAAGSDEQSLGDMSIEEAFGRLENAQTGLRESLDVYAEGVQLINRCRNYLCDVEKEMITLSGQEDE